MGSKLQLDAIRGKNSEPQTALLSPWSVAAEGPGRYTCRWFWDSYLRPWTGFGAEKYKWDQIAKGPVGVASIQLTRSLSEPGRARCIARTHPLALRN